MSIELKLQPTFGVLNYVMDKNILTVPASMSYHDRNDLFTFDVSYGMPINGRLNPDTHMLSYYIGETCSIEQLKSFIDGLQKDIPCNLLFGADIDCTNSISYDPSTKMWCHKTDSSNTRVGGSLTLNLTPEARQQFVETLKSYYMLAFVTIEGHKKLNEQNDDAPLSLVQ